MIKPIVKNEGCTVVFGPCRLSYTHLFAKYSMTGGAGAADGKYMTNVLIPAGEKETVKALQDAIEAAKRKGITAKWQGKEPRELALPLHDGDDKDGDEVYAGHYYINAKCATRPGVVDMNLAPIMDEDEIYSGVWAYVSVTFYPYSTNGKRGVAAGLNNVMKYKDGERLGGRANAENDFGNIPAGSTDDNL